MGNKTYVPRWLHARRTVGAGKIELLDSELFANIDLWPMQLHWLSLTGADANDNPAAPNLIMEVGISQKGDSATTYAYSDVLMAHNERVIQYDTPFDCGIRLGFPSPIDLPPDTGLVAEFQSHFNIVRSGHTYNVWNPGLLVNGFTLDPRGERRPAQLAGYVPADSVNVITEGTQLGVHNADLFNDGINPIFMHELIMTAGQAYFSPTSAEFVTLPALNLVSWRINPTSGVQWMPDPEPIPAGNLAPFSRGVLGTEDAGPRAYVFPDGVKLNPKQRVSVKVGNVHATKDQTFDLCLFGLMEVE